MMFHTCSKNTHKNTCGEWKVFSFLPVGFVPVHKQVNHQKSSRVNDVLIQLICDLFCFLLTCSNDPCVCVSGVSAGVKEYLQGLLQSHIQAGWLAAPSQEES